MLTHLNVSTFVKFFAAIAMILLLGQKVFAQATENQLMTFEGSLTDTSGNPINLQSQQLFYYISATDTNGDKCILFAESSTTSGDGDGNILHKFGTGSAVTSPISFNNVLSNDVFSGDAPGIDPINGLLCAVPAANARRADVYSAVLAVEGSVTLGAAPYSLFAKNASALNGKSDTDFVLMSSVSGGTTGQILSRTGSNGFAWINIPSTGLTPTNNLSDITSAAVARANLGLGTLATQNVITLNSQVTGTLQEANLPAFTGDVFSNAGDDNITVTGIRGRPVATTTPASGQVLAFNGSQWAPSMMVRQGGDIMTGIYGIEGGLGVASTTTTNADVIPILAIRRNTSNVLNGASNLGSMIIFEGENSTGANVVQTAISSRWTTATNTLEKSQLDFQTRLNGSMETHLSITSSGKVGVGTMTPTTKFEVLTGNSPLALLKQDSAAHDGVMIETTSLSAGQYALSVTNSNGAIIAARNDNRVGINTAMPMATLHVAGTTQIDGNAVVSGTIQLRSPASLPVACTNAEEGTQRYNKNHKTMEYCDGANWQGMHGPTYCDAGYILVGSPGVKGSYCFQNSVSTADYLSAVAACRASNPSRKSNAKLCSVEQYDRICSEQIAITGFFGPSTPYNWTSDDNWSDSAKMVRYTTTGATCPMTTDWTQPPDNRGRDISSNVFSNINQYRCCYE